jgi:hypothetical protein
MEMDEMPISIMQIQKLLEDPTFEDRLSRCESALDFMREMNMLDAYFQHIFQEMFKDADLTLKVHCPICKKEQRVERKMGILFEKEAVICKCLCCNSEFDLESADGSFKKFREDDLNVIIALSLELFLEANKRGLLGDEGMSEEACQSLSELSQALNKMLLSKGLLEEYHKDEKTGEIKILKEENCSY